MIGIGLTMVEGEQEGLHWEYPNLVRKVCIGDCQRIKGEGCENQYLPSRIL